MTLDIHIVEINLKQAEADVEFWKEAKRVLSDPRMALATKAAPETTPEPPAPIAEKAGFGDVKQAVYEHLPIFGATPVGTSALVAVLLNSGFRFRAKHHQMAVIDALAVLENDGKAFMAKREGIAKLWTKGSDKNQEAPEGAS